MTMSGGSSSVISTGASPARRSSFARSAPIGHSREQPE
jgi:hypothetical protein